jgi:hypothetical protein
MFSGGGQEPVWFWSELLSQREQACCPFAIHGLQVENSLKACDARSATFQKRVMHNVVYIAHDIFSSPSSRLLARSLMQLQKRYV